jgi:UDP-N-acetyl-D-galactosamine dehydrogenase
MGSIHPTLALCPKAGLLKPAHCVVLAVAHAEFLAGGWEWIQSILEKRSGVMIDVKGCLPRELKSEAVYLWRL